MHGSVKLDAMIFDHNNVMYLTDRWQNDYIRKIMPDGTVSTYAGDGTDATLNNTDPLLQRNLLNHMKQLDKYGNIYVSELAGSLRIVRKTTCTTNRNESDL